MQRTSSSRHKSLGQECTLRTTEIGYGVVGHHSEHLGATFVIASGPSTLIKDSHAPVGPCTIGIWISRTTFRKGVASAVIGGVSTVYLPPMEVWDLTTILHGPLTRSITSPIQVEWRMNSGARACITLRLCNFLTVSAKLSSRGRRKVSRDRREREKTEKGQGKEPQKWSSFSRCENSYDPIDPCEFDANPVVNEVTNLD